MPWITSSFTLMHAAPGKFSRYHAGFPPRSRMNFTHMSSISFVLMPGFTCGITNLNKSASMWHDLRIPSISFSFLTLIIYVTSLQNYKLHKTLCRKPVRFVLAYSCRCLIAHADICSRHPAKKVRVINPAESKLKRPFPCIKRELIAHVAFNLLFKNTSGKIHHFRKKQLEILIAALHPDNLLKKDNGIIVFLTKHKFFGKNESVVHKIFARKPFCQPEACKVHAHTFEFSNSLVLTVMNQIKKNQFCPALFVFAGKKPCAVIKRICAAVYMRVMSYKKRFVE